MTTSDMPFGYTWIEEHLDPIPGFTLTQSSLACRLNRISLSLSLSFSQLSFMLQLAAPSVTYNNNNSTERKGTVAPSQ